MRELFAKVCRGIARQILAPAPLRAYIGNRSSREGGAAYPHWCGCCIYCRATRPTYIAHWAAMAERILVMTVLGLCDDG